MRSNCRNQLLTGKWTTDRTTMTTRFEEDKCRWRAAATKFTEDEGRIRADKGGRKADEGGGKYSRKTEGGRTDTLRYVTRITNSAVRICTNVGLAVGKVLKQNDKVNTGKKN